MAGSNLTAFPFIQERSEATPGLWNNVFSIISQNIAEVNDLSNISSHVSTVGLMTIRANSNSTDYIRFADNSGSRSNYILGSHAGGTADGLNIYDDSGSTMIVSFSKQSIRFFQNVVGPVFDTGGALAATYNAATFIGSGSTLSGIQAAINQASIDGIARVYLPASLHSYDASKISFIHNVQMVLEGHDWSVFDAYAYGAAANNTGDDSYALRAAISGASAHGGGMVFLPSGNYSISSSIVMGATQTNSIAFVGRGRRDVVIIPTLSVTTAIQVGEVGKKTFYGVLAEFTVSAPSGHTGCGIWLQQPSYFNFERINIESYTSGTGLYVAGGAYSTGSEAVRNKFMQLLIATTQRPCYLQNVDENEWYSCNFGCLTGQTSAMTALEINQGRNNRFYGTLLSGHAAAVAARDNYTGVLFSAPVQPGGDNANNQFYGVVSEGFNQGFWVASSIVNNTVVLFHSSSINSSGLSDSGSQTLYVETGNLGNSLFQWPSGTPIAPTWAFRSESSMGWYRSRASYMALSSGVLEVPGTPFSATTPTITFSSNRSTGFIDNAGPGLDVVVAGTIAGRALASQWNTLAGTSILPSKAFLSEVSLGWYRSATSTMALSYGTLSLPGQLSFGAIGSAANPSLTWAADKIGLFDAGSNILGIAANQAAVVYVYPQQCNWAVVGSAITPVNAYFSERSLGFYRSAASTIAMSYGTFQTQELWATSGISVGNATAGGSLIPAISSTSSLVAAFVVQGSASSFTVITWTAVQPGDQILTTIKPDAAVSSLSSGLVLHSHATKAGQFEMRLSNVSTLAQNQSSKTYYFTRISPF